MFTHKDLIYHRGRHGYVARSGCTVLIPENSLQAFQVAVELGATMIEFDARKNPLGGIHFPIIAHDPGMFDKTPTIVEALDVIDNSCAVNIEIKDPSIWKRTLEIVCWYITHRRWSPEQFVISAFHHPTAMAIKQRHKSLKVGIIMDAIPDVRYLDILHDAHIDNLHMEYMNADMDMQHGGQFMTRAKALGFQTWVWTVNDIKTAKRVYDWGAERIFTDKPERFQ